jgi:hypothetical protein
MSTLSALFDELQADAEAAWAEIKREAAVAEHAIEVEAIAIVHMAEDELVSIMRQIKGDVIAKALALAGEEFAALTGAEKQSEVITHAIQAAEALGIEASGLLITAARTLAQNVFTALATTKPTS